MTNNPDEISSTEKLLKVIRSSSDKGAPQPGRRERAGLFSGLREKLLPSGKSRDCIGVEIFRDAINLVRTSKTRARRVVVHAVSEPLPDGLAIDHPEFAHFLREQIEKCGPRPQKADIWACLPASKGEMWSVRVPKVRKGLGHAVYWSARKEKSFNEAGHLFDYRITGETTEDGVQKRIAEVCIVPKADVDLYKTVFARAGFPLKGVTVPAFAAESLFYREVVEPGPEAFAVLFIGEESSWIDIHSEGRILFSRVIRTGRDSVIHSLMQEYQEQAGRDNEIVLTLEPETGGFSEETAVGPPGEGLSGSDEALTMEQAERILAGFATGSPQPAGIFTFEQVFGMIEPVLERLARQLERTFDHSVNVLKNPAPASIYICGTLPILPRIVGYFGDQLGIRATLLDVLDTSMSHVSPELVIPEPGHRFSLVSTTGLAMPTPHAINFLRTASDRELENDARRTTNAVAAGCALLIALTAGYWWTSAQALNHPRAEVERLEQSLAAFSPRVDMEMLTRLAGQYREEQQAIGEYSRKLQPVAMINEISRVTPENIKLLGLTMSMGRPGENKGPDENHMLVVEGFVREGALDHHTVLAAYVRQLRRSPLVRDITVRRAEKDHFLADGEVVYRFVLNIEFRKV